MTPDGRDRSRPLVVFAIDVQRYALDLAIVERVLPMVAVSPLANGPPVALGVVNLHGRVLAVVDLRRRLALPVRAYGPRSHLLVARTRRRTLALPVDEVLGVEEVPASAVVPAATVLPGIAPVQGFLPSQDGVLLIHDLEALLSLDDEARLEAALGEAVG